MSDEPTQPIEQPSVQAESRPAPTLPNPNVSLTTSRPYRPPLQRVRGPVSYDYDVLDWGFRIVFFAAGLGLGWLLFAHH